MSEIVAGIGSRSPLTWWVFATAFGCASPDPSLVCGATSIELAGYRTLRDDGRSTVRSYDRERLPVLRVEPPPTSPCTAELSVAGVPVATASTDDGALIRLRWSSPGETAPGPGPGRVVVRDEAGATRSWPVRWDRPPNGSPWVALGRLTRVRGWRAAGRAVLAFAAPSLTSEDALWAAVERARLAPGAAAPDAWRAAADVARRHGVPSEVSRRWRAAAYHRYRQRRYDDAEGLLRDASELDARHGHAVGEARNAYYRGLIASDRGDFRAAVASLRASRGLAERWGLEALTSAVDEALAIALSTLGRHADALAAIERARPSVEARRNDRAVYFRFLTNEGWLLLCAMLDGAVPRAFDRPRALFERARAVFPPDGDPMARAEVAFNLALVAWHAGELAGADRHLAEVRQWDPRGRSYAALSMRLLEARMALERGAFELAISEFDAVERRAGALAIGGVSDYTWQAHHGRGRALEGLGRAADAHRAYADALVALDVLATRTEIREARAPFFATRRQVVDDALTLALRRGRPRQALVIADSAHARSARALEARVRLDRLDPADRVIWKQRVDAYLDRRAAFEAARTEGDGMFGARLTAWQRAREVEREAIAALFDSAYAHLDAVAPSSVPGLTDSTDSGVGTPDSAPHGPGSAGLGEDEALVAFARAGERRLVFWVDAAGIEVLDTDEALGGPWRRRIEALLVEPLLVEPLLVEPLLVEPLLVEPLPVEPLLVERPRHLYVVPGHARAALALPTLPMADGQPLGAIIGISFVPHAAWLMRDDAPRTGPPIVIADANGDLPFARAEGRAVHRRLPGADYFEGATAQRGAVIERWNGASVIHFAGHGVLEPDNPWDAHLRLYGDARLSLSDVLIHRPALGLVVLSGCETGRPAVMADGELLGLPQAFLAVGARTVLATTQRVGDDESRRFIERFYDAGGLDNPGGAWRDAVAAMVDSGDDAWRPFILMGRP